MENCLPPSTALVCKLLERVLISFQHIMTMDLPSKYTINIHCPFDLHSARIEMATLTVSTFAICRSYRPSGVCLFLVLR